MKRRHLLQSIGLTLATLGISQLELQHRTLQYGKVLAQDTRRKRALLVGVSDYPGRDASDLKTQGLWYRLPGTLTDVELQRELLIHRFGFHPDDILVLKDKEATRNGILTAFETHLLQGVQSDRDVAIFHYSGHGSNVIDPHKVFPEDGLNGTIVPYDADLPAGYPQKGGEVNDITAGTIFLLREAIARKTKNATFILDSCYSGGGVRGNLILRSRPGQVELDDSQRTKLVQSNEETAEQQRWLKKLGWNESEWIDRRRCVSVKDTAIRKCAGVNGAAIFAAQRNQSAADVTFAENIHAGIFTYALTRQLWQQSSSDGMGKVIVAVSAKAEQFLKDSQNARLQTPGIEVQQGSQDDQQPMYFSTLQRSAAEAVISEVNGKAVKLLLTGTEPHVLEALGKGAVFTLVDNQGRPQGSVQIEARDRLTATGTLQTNASFKVTPGATLQEQVRAVPTDLTLRIGLDPSLGQEATTAKAHLRSLPRIEVVTLLEQEVHYILGRMTPAYHQALVKRLPPGLTPALQQQVLATVPDVNSVGLWSIGFDPIPGSFGSANETVKDAIQRLQTKFKLLLAARLLKMTLNTTSSRLNVVASMKVADTQALLAESFTVRGSNNAAQGKLRTINAATGRLAQVEINKPVQILVENREPQQALHIGVLVFSPDGDIDILFPLIEGKNAALVTAGQTLAIPSAEQIQSGVPLSFKAPLGLVEVLVVASTAPIAKALKPLQALIAEQQSSRRSVSQVAEKAEVAIASLLDDMAVETRGKSLSASTRRFDVEQMAALSITFEIVNEG